MKARGRSTPVPPSGAAEHGGCPASSAARTRYRPAARMHSARSAITLCT
jgi:hypothetical protein